MFSYIAFYESSTKSQANALLFSVCTGCNEISSKNCLQYAKNGK